MTDRQMLDDFLRFLEDHNYCKRVYCQNCMKWHATPEQNNVLRYCSHWGALTWASDWCSEAMERIKDYEMDSDK